MARQKADSQTIYRKRHRQSLRDLTGAPVFHILRVELVGRDAFAVFGALVNKSFYA